MFLFFTYHFSLLLLLLRPPPCAPARPPPRLTAGNYIDKFHNIENFLDAGRGSHVHGISQIKKYFHRFGYLKDQNDTISDFFGSMFESAVTQYQSKLGLKITGKLDFETLSQISTPRCGVPDTMQLEALHTTKHYVYFPGKPRWTRSTTPMKLTYAFSPENLINYLSLSDIREVFKRAFSKWASVIPVVFTETDDYGFADIKIGFYAGDHGDGEAFDGVLGVLAHAFSPESGRFHLDSAERWAVDFESEKSAAAVDLESVAVHEIGHLLGLTHSSVKEAVMYPSLKPRDRKVDLKVDDIEGVQALYGSNPNFTISSLLESDYASTNQGVDLRIRSCRWTNLMHMITICILGLYM